MWSIHEPEAPNRSRSRFAIRPTRRSYGELPTSLENKLALASFWKASGFFSLHPQSRQAKAELLDRFSPRMFVNLAALHREDLFPSAQQPAMVLLTRE